VCTHIFASVRGGCPRRGGRQVKNGGEEEAAEKREGAYCSEVILLDRGFRFPRCVRACFILHARLILVRESSKDYCLRSRRIPLALRPAAFPSPSGFLPQEGWRVFKYPRDARVCWTSGTCPDDKKYNFKYYRTTPLPPIPRINASREGRSLLIRVLRDGIFR